MCRSAGWVGLCPVPALLSAGPVAAGSRGKRVTVGWFQAQQHKATKPDKLQIPSTAKTEDSSVVSEAEIVF